MSKFIFDIMRQEIRATAERYGLRGPLADDLALSALDKVRVAIGGAELGYIAKVDRQARAEAIRAEYDGDNEMELARKHRLSERHVRRIIKEAAHGGREA